MRSILALALLCSLTFHCTCVRAQIDFREMIVFDGDGREEVQGIHIDDDGNRFYGGVYTGNLLVDGQPFPSATPNLESYQDAFIARFAPGGNTWVRSINRIDTEQGGAISQMEQIIGTGDGGIYAGGAFNGLVDLDTGPGLDTQRVTLAVIRFDAAGNQTGTHVFRKIQDNDFLTLHYMITDDAGGYYALLNTKDNFLFSSQMGTVEVDVPSRTRVVVHVNAAGEIRTVYSVKAASISFKQQLLAMTEDGLVMGISYVGTVDFDPGPERVRYTALDGWDAALIYFGTDGMLQKVTRFGGENRIYFEALIPDSDGGLTAAFDVSEDMKMISETGDTTVLWDNTTDDLEFVVASFNEAGVDDWVYGHSVYSDENSLAPAADGSVFVCGVTQGEGVFPVMNGTEISSVPDGAMWVQHIGTDGTAEAPTFVEFSDGPYIQGFATGPGGSLVVTGNGADDVFFNGTTYSVQGSSAGFAFELSGAPTGVAGYEVFERVPLLFPNPNGGEFSIELDREYRATKLEVYTIDGRLVYQQGFTGRQVLRVNLEVKSGLYFARVTAAGYSGILPVRVSR